MLLLTAAALAAQAAPDAPARQTVAPLVQAKATVRIVAGVQLQLGQPSAVAGQRLRWSTVSTPEGIRRASLVEFE